VKERHRERERRGVDRERESGIESETGRSPEKTRSEADFPVEPENPLDPGGSETSQETQKKPDPPTRPRGAIPTGPSDYFRPIFGGSTPMEHGTRFPATRVRFPTKSKMISDGFLRNSLGNLL
jgi:hypothetical protein